MGNDSAVHKVPSSLAVAVAEYALRTVDSHDLPKLALDAIVAGVDSLSLAALAGAERDTPTEELRDLFEQGIHEIGLELPDRKTAATLLKRYYASQVVEGALLPREGAARIKDLPDRVDDLYRAQKCVGDTFGVSEVIGLYWQFDEVDSYDEYALSQIDDALIAACERILAG